MEDIKTNMTQKVTQKTIKLIYILLNQFLS